MKHLVAIIEKGEDGGYAIYSKDVDGLFGSGLTETEAKSDFCEVLEEQAEYYKEHHAHYPDWYRGGYEIEYRYDMSAFFLSFPFINVSEFAKAVGINSSLMRKYKSGLASASEKQKNLIQEKFMEIVTQLERVKFG
ncbi:type II toxin-antitoxin system HicB family antitoxin [Bacteroides pyogenes]|uniref:type II toxin-antitoxin system HicB family antitoxin n=1 Tax=Bacteroides pyogenes TaxID=310300 RepID=UPI002A918B6E|nr:type II toxin-antitoxin system HicB family antitoxin [Bacteroides pyogenes]MDY5433697.1 type II toxin-antitoxin system HicB family antitoxin [Bacteroides pyogenes]